VLGNRFYSGLSISICNYFKELQLGALNVVPLRNRIPFAFVKAVTALAKHALERQDSFCRCAGLRTQTKRLDCFN
jgi:hypothetical protein